MNIDNGWMNELIDLTNLSSSHLSVFSTNTQWLKNVVNEGFLCGYKMDHQLIS